VSQTTEPSTFFFLSFLSFLLFLFLSFLLFLLFFLSFSFSFSFLFFVLLFVCVFPPQHGRGLPRCIGRGGCGAGGRPREPPRPERLPLDGRRRKGRKIKRRRASARHLAFQWLPERVGRFFFVGAFCWACRVFLKFTLEYFSRARALIILKRGRAFSESQGKRHTQL
jgi:hypothetical protein